MHYPDQLYAPFARQWHHKSIYRDIELEMVNCAGEDVLCVVDGERRLGSALIVSSTSPQSAVSVRLSYFRHCASCAFDMRRASAIDDRSPAFDISPNSLLFPHTFAT